MQRETYGGWVYTMANRYRGRLCIGVTSDLAARVTEHRCEEGSESCAEHGITRLVWAEFTEPIASAIQHERRLKRWRRAWQFDLIEKANPNWHDLFDELAGWRRSPAPDRVRGDAVVR